MDQIFLFIGENRYALREEVQRWRATFREKYGAENLASVSARNLTVRALLDEVAVAPFIAEKRLVVVDGIPSLSKEEIGVFTKEIHPQVVLLFIEPKPDKRLSATKELIKIADVKEFKPLVAPALKKWMMEFLKEQGSSMSSDAQKLLLDTVGEDQEMLAEELKKLALLATGREIESADITQSVISSGEQVVWRLLDLLGEGKKDEALAFAKGQLDRGESPYALWNRLLWMINNLVAVSAALAEGQTSPPAIAKSTGVNFMSVRSLLPLARTLDTDRLCRIVSDAVEADMALKTGVYRVTAEAPQELNALIDRMILSV